MQLGKQQRRVIVDAIGLLQEEASRGLAEIYREQTLENACEIQSKLATRLYFLQSALNVCHEMVHLETAGALKVRPLTELERDLAER